MLNFRRLAAFAAACLLSGAVSAQELITKKQVFEMASYTTLSGKPLKAVKVGYETYGALSAARDNAILVPHFFSGNSHAAGKYTAGDKAPGYWDAIIGPGKAIDTNKYFVISVDSLVNLNTKDPNTVTTGPATINPDTGKPYGMAFPIVTIGDFVQVQKALIDSLGITRLRAVVGASMGALQAQDWAARYPDMVERLVPVIGSGDGNPWLIAWLNVWAAPILLDPAWKGGEYYGGPEPVEGLKHALKIVSLHANHWLWAEKTFGRAWAEEGKDPLASFANKYKIEQALEQGSAARAAVSDANHFLYLVKANQTFEPGGAKNLAEFAKKLKAKTLFIYSPADQVFPQEWVKATAEAVKAAGVSTDTFEIGGNFGHLNGVLGMLPAADKLKAFIEN